ncbi:NAD(P)-binding protein [Bimuria novae-zelandiae CBS 107.79]|uniref:NAD(P)-binding protein n=1 Tax=Bimuria novae-zelandiae CBS 107.79 TaxID=1447943 RepID=A0A6A5UVG5_9PLEO|nr:NAD(P)-binding protein [Bimuria novae-zelandiae CBS 107.79]
MGIGWNPSKDIPDLSGKVIVVTGGSSGLGKESVHQLVKHNPSKIYLTARTSARGNAAINAIESATPAAKGKIAYLEVDMASLASVKRAADRVLTAESRLDILMSNAGVMAVPAGVTEDGYESQFGTNHMGPSLFTKLLLLLLSKTATAPDSDVHIVNLSSELFKSAPMGGILFDSLKTPQSEISSMARYGQSKLADALHTHILAQKYPQIKSVALHPSVVNTGLLDTFKKDHPIIGGLVGVVAGIFLTNVHDGAKRQLWAATAPSKEVKNGAITKDEALAERLWEWTNKELEAKGF